MNFYVISLKKDTKRREDLSAHLAEFGIEPCFIEAHSQLPEGIIRRDSDIRLTQMLCNISHSTLLSFVPDEDFVVCEDDVRFTDNPIDVIKKIRSNYNSIEFLWLGAFSGSRPRNIEISTESFLEHPLWEPWGSHAYWIHRNIIDFAINQFNSQEVHADGVTKRLAHTNNGYLLRPSVAYQFPYESNIAQYNTMENLLTMDFRNGTSHKDKQFICE